MNYSLSRRAILKWLEVPSVYHIAKDELYELDDDSFRFMKNCMTGEGSRSQNSAFIDYCMDEGILTTEKVTIDRPALLPAPAPSLRYLELQITDACNLKCKHCYIDGASGNELPSSQIRSLLKQFEKMQGLRVLITGGEPLLHSRFEEINEMLPDFFIRKVLFTNGVFISKATLKPLKVDEIQISIDGLEEAHDAVRGTGMFNRSMKGVRLALDAGFDVSISTMVHKQNLEDFDALELLFRTLGIKDWTVDIPCRTGRLKNHEELAVSPEQGGKLLGYGFGGGLHSSGQGYACGLHLMAVTANGKFAKCSFYSALPLDSADKDLLSTWQMVKPIMLKNLSCDCDYIEVCRGGCRYRAELMEGKGGKDRYRCTLYGIR